MKPSEICKAVGLRGLVELSEITNKSVQTLNNTSKQNPVFFDVIVLGAAVKKITMRP